MYRFARAQAVLPPSLARIKGSGTYQGAVEDDGRSLTACPHHRLDAVHVPAAVLDQPGAHLGGAREGGGG